MATITVPNFKKENELIVPTFEKKKKEEDQEEPKTQLEKDFPNMSVSEIIDTGGKGYTEEEKLQNIIVPDISKKGFFEKALPITYKQIEYIWKEPIGLSEENKKIYDAMIADKAFQRRQAALAGATKGLKGKPIKGATYEMGGKKFRFEGQQFVDVESGKIATKSQASSLRSGIKGGVISFTDPPISRNTSNCR